MAETLSPVLVAALRRQGYELTGPGYPVGCVCSRCKTRWVLDGPDAEREKFLTDHSRAHTVHTRDMRPERRGKWIA